jgi:Flp pilus assembly protein TadG
MNPKPNGALEFVLVVVVLFVVVAVVLFVVAA